MAETYELVHVNRAGHERRHPYTSEEPLAPGSVVHYEGRDWLVDGVDGTRVTLEPARYRLRLRHPDGHEELGALRRYRADAPRAGHTCSTIEGGAPASWQVADERLARDEQGEPYLATTGRTDHREHEGPTRHSHYQ